MLNLGKCTVEKREVVDSGEKQKALGGHTDFPTPRRRLIRARPANSALKGLRQCLLRALPSLLVPTENQLTSPEGFLFLPGDLHF